MHSENSPHAFRPARPLLSALAFCLGFSAMADTDFPIPAATQSANRDAVEAYRKVEGCYWKDAPFAVCAVEPLSGIRRTPDLLPADGDFTGPVRVIAAQGEYEPGSFLLFGFEDIGKVEMKAGDLVGPRGRIPASAIDLKIVKVWYQQGTAWGGFHHDPLRRVPTPELLLHDEDLIEVDHGREENFARCDYRGGTTATRWISFSAPPVDHSYAGPLKFHWIHDADAIRPFRLQKNAFKQVMATIHVPDDAKGGIYKGSVAVMAKGKTVQVPFALRVLPFQLPTPATFRDTNREFFGSGFLVQNGISGHPKVARNLAAHNVRHPLLNRIPTEKDADELFDTLKEAGMGTNRLFSILPGSGLMTSFPAKETDRNYNRYREAVCQASNALQRIRRRVGDSPAYSYAIDEAGPNVIRLERGTWQAFQSMGGNILATTRYHPYLLFNVDFALTPIQPSPVRKLNADAMHAANPETLVGWYADPHSGPENPAYTRRIYGWISWRNNYDLFCQYTIFRDDWTEFFICKEAFLRGIMLCYPSDDDILDTLAWEGVREAMDDIRYGTLLRLLAQKAKASDDIDTVYAGRAASTWIAQVDFERSSLESLRYETIRRILDLRKRLEK